MQCTASWWWVQHRRMSISKSRLSCSGGIPKISPSSHSTNCWRSSSFCKAFWGPARRRQIQLPYCTSSKTAVLRLQDGFGQLYEYLSSKSGGYFSGTMKPLLGVDGKRVMHAQGKLSILKSGFERVRLEKPPTLSHGMNPATTPVA